MDRKGLRYDKEDFTVSGKKNDQIILVAHGWCEKCFYFYIQLAIFSRIYEIQKKKRY